MTRLSNKSHLQLVKEFRERFELQLPKQLGTELKDDLNILIKCIREELSEFEEAVNEDNLIEIVDAAVDLEYFVLQIYLVTKTDSIHKELFDEVHKSNLAKLQPNGKVKKNEFGKVVKPEGWKKPDLRKVIERHKILSDNLLGKILTDIVVLYRRNLFPYSDRFKKSTVELHCSKFIFHLVTDISISMSTGITFSESEKIFSEFICSDKFLNVVSGFNGISIDEAKEILTEKILLRLVINKNYDDGQYILLYTGIEF